MATNGAKEKLWTPSNIITLIRICLVPVFVVAIIAPWPSYFISWNYEWIKSWVACGIFILIAATDGVDGYLARRRGEITNFGKLFDPLADKILVAAALLALIELGDLPSWVALIILTREFIVAGIRMVAASQGVVIAASWTGKAKTIAQIVAIVLFIIKRGLEFSTFHDVLQSPLYLTSWGVMFIALILTIVSLVDYFIKSRELLGFNPSKSRRFRKTYSPSQDIATNKAETVSDTENYSDDSLNTLTSQVLEKAQSKGVTIGTAESLTGGLIAATLTSIPGSSATVRGGIVSYASDVKQDILDIDQEVIEEHGVVSEVVACSMANGALDKLACDLSIAVTGIAGPDGGSKETPVGTVWIARAGFVEGEDKSCAHRYCFEGEREDIRFSTVKTSLELLLEAL